MIRNKKILCTRPSGDSEQFKKILEEACAEVIDAPFIEILPIEDYSELDSKLKDTEQYSGIIFTSANGVKHFFGRTSILGIKPACSIYAVGEKTALAAEAMGFSVNAIPESFDSESLAEMLNQKEDHDSRYLFPTGNLGMKNLVNSLNNVDEVIVYKTQKPSKNPLTGHLKNLLDNKEINCIAFFSPSAVSNFAELYPGYKNTNADIAAIGKTTRDRIESIGLKAKIVAEKATTESLGEEIIKYYDKGQGNAG